MEVPADTLPVRGATALVAVMPVPASPSGGARGIPGQNVPQLPGIIPGGDKLIKLANHPIAVVAGSAVDGEHPRSVSHTKNVDTCEHEVNVACKGGNVSDSGDMLLTIQNCLIQVCDAPSLGDIESEQLRQFLRGRAGNGVLPGSEGGQQLPVPVEGQVAMHHGADAHGLHVFRILNTGYGSPEPLPDRSQVIGPDSVRLGAGPGIVPGGKGQFLAVNKKRSRAF